MLGDYQMGGGKQWTASARSMCMSSNVAVSPRPSRTSPRRRAACAEPAGMVAVGVCVLIAVAGAGPASAQNGVGFRLDLGYQEPGGEWGHALDGAMDGEVSLLYGLDGLRLGAGLNWASLPLADVDRRSWHHLTSYLLLGYGRAVGRRVRPFGEVRYVWRTARPEGSRLFDEEPPREPVSPFRAKGDGAAARLGVEVLVTERAALSLSGERQWFGTEPPPVDDEGLGPVGAGTSWRLGAGLTWFLGRGEGASTGADSGTDGGGPSEPSGSEPSLGLAVGVGSLGLLVPWVWNEHVKSKPFTLVSPRSWWRGVTNGFAWDDNDFDVNYHRHAYHGMLYFDAARANGYGFGRALLHTVVGSYLWECCTETHIASIPDMVTTVAGGAAYGEAMHRVSSRILDDFADGTERVLRETVAAVLNPPRGVTRLVTGRAWKTERRVPGARTGEGPDRLRLVAGARRTDRSSEAGRHTLPYVGIEWAGGDLFGDDDGPFSYHRLRVGLLPGDRYTMGHVNVRGSLWRGEPAERDGRITRLSTHLDVDFVNTWAYRFAAHGVTGAWALALPLGERLGARVEAEASLVLMGSVDSEYAPFAEIRGVRERLRRYDFGVGPGGRIAVSLTRDGDDWMGGSYRMVYLETLNGSNVAGSRSFHLVHILAASARHEVVRGWGVGVDFDLFVQDSRYGFVGFEDEFRRRSEARLHLFWRPTFR